MIQRSIQRFVLAWCQASQAAKTHPAPFSSSKTSSRVSKPALDTPKLLPTTERVTRSGQQLQRSGFPTPCHRGRVQPDPVAAKLRRLAAPAEVVALGFLPSLRSCPERQDLHLRSLPKPAGVTVGRVLSGADWLSSTPIKEISTPISHLTSHVFSNIFCKVRISSALSTHSSEKPQEVQRYLVTLAWVRPPTSLTLRMTKGVSGHGPARCRLVSG